jgi:hypothetical protein
MSLGARFALLLAPLFAVLDANAACALENADFAASSISAGVAGSISSAAAPDRPPSCWSAA